VKFVGLKDKLKRASMILNQEGKNPDDTSNGNLVVVKEAFNEVVEQHEKIKELFELVKGDYRDNEEDDRFMKHIEFENIARMQEYIDG
jgi:predicted transposase YbfD/YdcC